jgi:predicted ribosomally synthesized peptide with nif11-like leader
MTDRMRSFLEEASKDKDFVEKLNKAATPADVIRLAAEKGFALTEEDMKNGSPDGELSDDELNTVAGGFLTNAACGCVLAGGGDQGAYDQKDEVCLCVMGGEGKYEESYREYKTRCVCALGGGGKSYD